FLQKIFNAVGLFYVLHVYPLQFDALDGYNWQMEHFFALNVLPQLLGNRVYASGFADHNLGPDGSDWVTETQLGIRLIQQLYAVTEYRHNEFVTDQDGLAFGAEYKIL